MLQSPQSVYRQPEQIGNFDHGWAGTQPIQYSAYTYPLSGYRSLHDGPPEY